LKKISYMNILESGYARFTGIKSEQELYKRLLSVKHVALDMDGTIYKGSTLFPFTVQALDALRQLNIGYSFLTNNSSKSTAEYLIHLRGLGIPATMEQIYTSTRATIKYLQIHHPDIKKLFILGTPGMIREFEEAGFISADEDAGDRPEAVVAGYDNTLVYSRLCRAAWWISEGLLYLATNPDRVCPTDRPVVLVDCGSICACLEHATGRAPDVVTGKPDSRMLDGILATYNCFREQVAVVGDRIYTDMKLAFNAKVTGVLVLSGESGKDTVEKSDLKPDIITEDLSVLVKMMQEAYRHRSDLNS
jgi:NagD protein